MSETKQSWSPEPWKQDGDYIRAENAERFQDTCIAKFYHMSRGVVNAARVVLCVNALWSIANEDVDQFLRDAKLGSMLRRMPPACTLYTLGRVGETTESWLLRGEINGEYGESSFCDSPEEVLALVVKD